MGERMRKIPVYLPLQMLSKFKACAENDGRSPGELVRMFIGEWIIAREMRVEVMRSVNQRKEAK